MAIEKRPEVLILGRPNVGKSTLLNHLLKRNHAITFDEPGVTRDLIHFPYTWQGRDISLVDSGGVWLQKTQDVFQGKIETLVKEAIERAEKIIFLVDYKTGLHPLDASLAKFLRPYKDKVILTLNKVDDPGKPTVGHEFLKLGLGEPMLVSSLNNLGLKELMSQVVKTIPRQQVDEPLNRYKVAFLGRPNVGKSSLLNAIVNQERVIVSDIPGTTRDAVEVSFRQNDNQFVFIDTAGVRKKAKIEDGIEYYAVIRTERSVEEADLVVLLLDAKRGMSQQDKRLIQMAIDHKKSMIIYVNKWDLTERTDTVRKDMESLLVQTMPMLENYPIIFGSALEKHHIQKLIDAIPTAIEASTQRISTAQLNQFVSKVLKRNPPPSKFNKKVQIYYCTQSGISPPHFVFFVNHPSYISADYTRFLEKRLRKYFEGFVGATLEISYKKSE